MSATLFLVNLFFLIWRVAHRIYFTTRVYSLRQGLMSAPRLIVANFVNFFASARATRIYVHHRLTGTPLVWDKTTHSYPFKLEPITPFNPRDQFSRAMPPPRAAARRRRADVLVGWFDGVFGHAAARMAGLLARPVQRLLSQSHSPKTSISGDKPRRRVEYGR